MGKSIIVSGIVCLFAVACTPATETTATSTAALTAADVAAPEAKDSPARDVVGQLVCRTHSVADGTNEVYLAWNGSSAKGTLRHVTPSGMVSTQNLRAEHHKDMIIADDTLADDVAVHAVTLKNKSGKQLVRLGDWKQPWTACE